MGIGGVGSTTGAGPTIAQVLIHNSPADFQMQRDPGGVVITQQPLILEIDTWSNRQADLGIYKPLQFIPQARAQAQAAASEATVRIVQEGDQMAHIETKRRMVPEIAENREAQNAAASSGDLNFSFLSSPSITWSGGGVSIESQPGQISVQFEPQSPQIDFLI
jgi:hypothetical protein